ncbi:MAG TPA: alanine--tRNA ligase [Cytophagaceae bacterium]
MDSKSIRQKYLDFFKSKGHQIVNSAPIVLKNDPTLMFTNAGMNQFKDYFLGNETPKYKRVADTQKCLRVSGKHNDLEEVGLDTYHHTMFEMLGNWSFGDYFKNEAIEWSWELLTEVYKLPKDRIYVSVFGGDASEGLERDDEAFEIWKKFIDPDRIIYGSKKDNFWEMGDQGPCGPCSEIHVDLRSEEEVKRVNGKDLVNEGDPLVVEIWNNVFIQYNRKADGSLESLPAKHVDTGMGFERLCMAVQKKTSNYDTDVFQPIIQYIAGEAGKKYGENEQTDIAIRVLSDHIRAISFTIADGQLPSNNKAGYVIRRILRRAVRYSYTFLDFKVPFIYRLVPLLADQFADVFPELKAQQDFVQKVIQEEEISFLRTLEIGLKKLEQIKEELKGKSDTINGKVVFDLYDTFGFPLDLTALIAREAGYKIDEPGFEKEMSLQKDRSRKAATSETSDWVMVNDVEKVEFVGYDDTSSLAKIVKYRKVKTQNKEQYHIVLDTTPFYAESGGQVGDTGFIESNGTNINVVDTKKENDLIIHITDKLPSDFSHTFNAQIDTNKRALSQSNHSATHLLHAALKSVLGTHVNQKGSLVNDKVLRFDFSHYSKVTDEELRQVEKIVNRKIRENVLLDERRNVPISDAKNMGAMALFGEKYGEFVRVITFDKSFSVELCGGTHVKSTGSIGLFKIIAESSVAAGVRRIEAVTAEAAEEFVYSQTETVSKIRELLRTPGDIVKATDGLLEERNKLQKQIEELMSRQTASIKAELISKAIKSDNINFIVDKIEAGSAEALKQISYEIKNKLDNVFVVLGSEIDGKPTLSVMISENLVNERKLDARTIIKELAKEIQGGGGGQAFYATAGGKNAAGLDSAIARAKGMIKELV